MKSIVVSDLAPDFLVQGLGLHYDDRLGYIGKVGRQEVRLVTSLKDVSMAEGDVQVISVGVARSATQFRAGDILMAGSDDLLDRAFQALDDLEQRGLVVSTSPASDSNYVYVPEKELADCISKWKGSKSPFLCLWRVEPMDADGQAKLVTLIRKVIT